MTTIENASAVLRLLNQSGVTQGLRGLTFTDITTALDLPKSTVSRLLSTMELQGLLKRDTDSRRFYPGDVLLSLASRYLSTSLVEGASAIMARLAEESVCTGYIAVLEGRETMIMRMFQGHKAIQVVSPPGSRLPAAETSVGRAMLARQSDEYIHSLYGSEWQVASHHAPQNLQQLMAELTSIRTRGWAISRNETVQGISSIATSVSNKHLGETIALGLTFPTQRQEPASSSFAVDALLKATRHLVDRYGDEAGKFQIQRTAGQ